jgi:hypothetical protein
LIVEVIDQQATGIVVTDPIVENLEILFFLFYRKIDVLWRWFRLGKGSVIDKMKAAA